MITAQAADFQATLAYARIVAETNRNIWMNCIHTSGKRIKDRPKDLAQKAAQTGGRIETMFHVIDRKTGTWANPARLAANEEWANGLIWCDMEGFAQLEDGTLILCDETGSFVYCPADRFEIVDTRKQTVINYLPKPSVPRKRNTASPKRPRSKWTFVPRRKA